MMEKAMVWVLVSVHTIAPFHHPNQTRLIREYQSTFARQDTCVAIMQEMNRASADDSWYCERHIVE
jgi:hypothetical protein